MTDIVEIAFRLLREMKRKLEQLIAAGVFGNKSEAFRQAIQDLIQKHSARNT